MMTQIFNLTRNKLPTLSQSKPMPDLKDYMTVQEAANKLGFHVITIRQMARDKKLDGTKIGASWLILKKSVDVYLKTNAGMSKHDPRRGKE